MTPAIQIQQVHKRFGAVQDALRYRPGGGAGEFFGLLGPNGAARPR